jgi:heme/copper-type cytochrome/quinol oxidase subunit 2
MPHAMRTAARVAAVVLVVAVLLPAVVAACPLCSEAASKADSGGASLWKGMFLSILFMMATPFVMVGAVAVMILRARRRRLREMPEADAGRVALFPGSGGARA